MSKNKKNSFIPVIIAISIVIGILIGTYYTNHFSKNQLGTVRHTSNKLNDLLHIVNDLYVDTVDMTELVEQKLVEQNLAYRSWSVHFFHHAIMVNFKY